MDGLECSQHLIAYATPDEIRTLRHVLRERYRMLGREMKQIKAELGPRAQSLHACQLRRQDINQLLRDMDDGTVPTRGRNSNVANIGEKPPLLQTIQDRYDAAYRVALEKRWAEIDESDWQRELKRRAAVP
jgi:hypothetical protein